jgi:hypothetical protein
MHHMHMVWIMYHTTDNTNIISTTIYLCNRAPKIELKTCIKVICQYSHKHVMQCLKYVGTNKQEAIKRMPVGWVLESYNGIPGVA